MDFLTCLHTFRIPSFNPDYFRLFYFISTCRLDSCFLLRKYTLYLSFEVVNCLRLLGRLTRMDQSNSADQIVLHCCQPILDISIIGFWKLFKWKPHHLNSHLSLVHEILGPFCVKKEVFCREVWQCFHAVWCSRRYTSLEVKHHLGQFCRVPIHPGYGSNLFF